MVLTNGFHPTNLLVFLVTVFLQNSEALFSACKHTQPTIPLCFDEGLTLKMPALKLFTMAN